jgi:hypothetical protein
MNRHSRLDLLAKSMARASQKAETSKEYPTCPSCGAVLEGWRPSEETSGVDNDDDQNEQDNGAQPDDYDNRTVTRLNNLAQSLTEASNKASK